MSRHLFQPSFCPKFSRLLSCIVKQFYSFLIFHYYTIIIDLRLSAIFCLSSGDIYLSLGISLSFSFVIGSELFCCEFFGTFVISRYSIIILF